MNSPLRRDHDCAHCVPPQNVHSTLPRGDSAPRCSKISPCSLPRAVKRVWWEQFNLCETGLSSLPDMSRCTEDCPVCNLNKFRFRQIFTSNGGGLYLSPWFLLKDIFTLPSQIGIIWELRLNRNLRKALRIEESLHLEKEKVTKVENIVCLNTCVWISEYMLRFWYVIWAVSTMSLGVSVQTWTWPFNGNYVQKTKEFTSCKAKIPGNFWRMNCFKRVTSTFPGMVWSRMRQEALVRNVSDSAGAAVLYLTKGTQVQIRVRMYTMDITGSM